MVLILNAGDVADELYNNQQTLALSGTGWASGGEATLVADSEPIAVDVTAASVRIDGTSISVGAGTVTLRGGDASCPRRDIIYADADGNLGVEAGQPQFQMGTDVQPDNLNRPAQLEQPRPPDTLRFEGVPLAEVWVPARAESAADLEAYGSRAIRDRRQPVVTDASLSGDHGQLSGLSDDDHPQYLLGDGTRNADESLISGGVAGRVLADDGIDSAWQWPLATESFADTTLQQSGSEDDSIQLTVHCPAGVTLEAIGIMDDATTTQSAVEAAVEVEASATGTHTTTAKHEALSESYDSDTDLIFALTNTSTSDQTVTAKLWYRPHLS